MEKQISYNRLQKFRGEHQCPKCSSFNNYYAHTAYVAGGNHWDWWICHDCRTAFETCESKRPPAFP